MGAKELYEKRKKQGICVYCKKEKAIENRIYCRKCREKKLTEQKETYEWLKEKGICVHCRKKKAFGKNILCADCLEKSTLRGAKYYQEHKSEKNEKNKALARIKYREHKEQGVCVRCGKRNAVPGKVLCSQCNAWVKTYQNEHYIKKAPLKADRNNLKLCSFCAKPLNNHPKLCDECHEKYSERMKRLHESANEKIPASRKNAFAVNV